MRKMKEARRKKGIVTSKREPKLLHNLKMGWKGFKRQMWNALAGIGFVTVLVLLANALGGG